MNFMLENFRQFWKRFIVSLLIFSLCRLIFVLFNHSSFPNLNFRNVIQFFLFGIRFDMVAAIYVNALILLICSLLGNFIFNKWYRNFTQILFIVLHIPALILELIDVAFFPYNLKRSTIAITKVGDEVAGQWKTYLVSFWYLFLILFLLIYLLNFISKKWLAKNEKTISFSSIKNYWIKWFAGFLVSVGLCILMVRGGWQYIPISATSAGEMVDEEFTPIITNTTFTFFQSAFLPQIEAKRYFSDDTCKSLFTNQFYISKNDTLEKILHRKPNVMIIIWESLAKEYVGYFNHYPKSYTPFLDSICSNSLVCTNAFANAKHSHEGMCAVMAGIPSLMDFCFYYSSYQSNRIKGVGEYLKEMNYSTAFFHGGNNGSMKFNSFSKLCGFEKYYGRNEYTEPERDFDGTWGIWDDKFFPFVADKMNDMKEPFCTGLFTLSSHHPYIVPNFFEGKFPKGQIEILQTVAYTDYALQQFFAKASKMKWFENTLFIITGDHTSQNSNPMYNNTIGAFKLPLVFYMPGKLKGRIDLPTQQVDILPTVLEMCGYEGNAASFGRSVFQADSNSTIASWVNDNYLICNNKLGVIFNGKNVTNCFEYKKDTACKTNVAMKYSKETNELSIKIKAVIQTYNNAMLHNKLYPSVK